MAIIPSVGAKGFLGYAPEVTAGTPVAATNYIPVSFDNINDTYDPARTIVKVAAGTLFDEQYVVDQAAKVALTIEFPLFVTMGHGLIFNAALLDTVTGSGSPYTHAGAMSAPKPVTLEICRAGESWQYAGCYAREISVKADPQNITMVTVTFDGMVEPVLISPSTPSYTAGDQPYSWRTFQSATLLAAGASVATVDQWEVTASFDNQLFYGNTGSGLPSAIIPGEASVKGSYRKLFDSVTEYNRFVSSTLGVAPTTLAFGFSQSGSKSVTFTMNNGIYVTEKHEGGLNAPVLETFEYHALAPGGANPLTVTVLNGVSTAYTTT